MNLKRAFWPSLCMPLLFFSGCHRHATLVTFIASPNLQKSYPYAEEGSKIEWYSDPELGQAGLPFTVSTNLPCRDMGHLSSDGKTPATCQLEKGKTGSYWVSFSPGTIEQGPKHGKGPPATVMHVGPCTGCAVDLPGFPGAAEKAHLDPPDPYLVCDDNNKASVTPLNLDATLGDQFYWTYAAGSYSKFAINLPAGICGPQAVTITSEKTSCTAFAPTTQAVQYTISIPNSCKGGDGTATISISPAPK
jgi:hypothetical protein